MEHEISIIRTNMGGSIVRHMGSRKGVQMMDCHMIVDVNKAFRPKRRNRIVGDALTNASTMGLERP